MACSLLRAASRSMASTNTRLIGNAPWLPPVTSSRNGLPSRRGVMEKNSRRTGQPVTIAFFPHARSETSWPVAIRAEILASTLFVKPGSAFGSKMTLGTRPSQVANNMGPAAYPPTPSAATGLCLRNTRRASIIAGTSIARFRSSVAPPLPFKPATRSVSSGSPACGTSFISIPRCVPTSTTSLSFPLESHSCAMASAGKTCPPVPPPAISNFTGRALAEQGRNMLRPYNRNSPGMAQIPSCLCRLLRNIQKHTSGQQHDQQTRSAIADEGQRDSFRRNHAKHHREIHQRLAQDHRGYSQRQQSPESVRRTERRAHPSQAINDKERNHDHRPDETQFLADHRIDKIRVRLRQIEELLFALHQANARETAGADGDERLQQLKSSALRIGIRVQESRQSGLPVRYLGDEQIHHGNRSREPHREPLPRETSNEKNGGGHNENIDRRPKVRLQQNQCDKDQNGTSRWKNRPPEIFLAEFHAGLVAALVIQKPRQIKNRGEFRQFRRLDAHRAELDPAMRGMRLVEEKRADEQEQDDANYGIDDRGLSQTPIIRLHQSEHSQKADEKPRGLADEKYVRVAVLLFSGNCRGAEDHHGAEQTERQRHSKEPAVIFQSSRHAPSPSSRSCTRRLPLQLMHQVFEDAAAVFVVLKLIEAGACRGEEHHVAGPRCMRSNFHGALDRSGALDGHAAGDLFFNFFRSRADEQRKNSLLTQRSLQHGVIAAFVFPAQNDQNLSGKSIQGLQRGIDIRCLRIVVIAHASDLRNEFQTMLDARERPHPFRDSRGFGPSETRRRHGRKDVFDVVSPRQGNLLETQYRLFFAVMAKHNFVFLHERTLHHTLLPAETVHMRLSLRQGGGCRISRVQHRAVRFRLVLEDSRFGPAILFERVMPVQVVGREIQKHADVRAKCFNQLQLKAAQLHHSDGVGAGLLHSRNQGSADIPSENRGKTSAFQNM